MFASVRLHLTTSYYFVFLWSSVPLCSCRACGHGVVFSFRNVLGVLHVPYVAGSSGFASVRLWVFTVCPDSFLRWLGRRCFLFVPWSCLCPRPSSFCSVWWFCPWVWVAPATLGRGHQLLALVRSCPNLTQKKMTPIQLTMAPTTTLPTTAIGQEKMATALGARKEGPKLVKYSNHYATIHYSQETI